MSRTDALSATVLLLVLIFMPLDLSGQGVYYSGSVQYSAGDYIFAERTGSWYFVNEVGTSIDRISIRLSVPVVHQTSPWISYTTFGSISTGGTQQGAVKGQGGSQAGQGRGRNEPIVLTDTTEYKKTAVSDPSVTVSSYLVNDPWRGRSLQVRGSMKAPLADPDNGFGTGAWDFSLGLSAGARSGQFMLFADVAYWVFGDMAELPLINSVSAGASVGRSFDNGKNSIMASASGHTVIVSGTKPGLTVGLGFGRILPGGHSVNVNGFAGLTESTPDYGIGVGWRFKLSG